VYRAVFGSVGPQTSLSVVKIPIIVRRVFIVQLDGYQIQSPKERCGQETTEKQKSRTRMCMSLDPDPRLGRIFFDLEPFSSAPCSVFGIVSPR
jgi:hypothetical protein